MADMGSVSRGTWMGSIPVIRINRAVTYHHSHIDGGEETDMTHADMMERVMMIAEHVDLEPTAEQIAEHDAIIDQYRHEQMDIAECRCTSTIWDADRQEYRETANGHTWWHPMYWTE